MNRSTYGDRFVQESWESKFPDNSEVAAMRDETIEFFEPISLLQRMVRIDTSNPPGNESHLCDLLEGPLRDIGFIVERYQLSMDRESLIAYPGGALSSLICFTGHLDTVPIGKAQWQNDPFGGVIDRDCVFGRGASDMKGGIAAFLAASARHREQTGQAPPVLIVLTAGEETGCEGARNLIRLKSRNFPVSGVLVGEPTLNSLLVGHKGALWLRAETSGVCAHGSMPELGDNAIYHLTKAVELLQNYRISPGSDPLLGRSTLNVGTIQGGTSVNLVPDLAQMEIDIRTVIEAGSDALLDDLGRYLGEKVKLTSLVNVPSLQTDRNHIWVNGVAEIISSVTGHPCGSNTASFFTDGPALKEIFGSVPVVIVGPGDPKCAHKTNEYCSIERLNEAVEIFSKIMEGNG